MKCETESLYAGGKACNEMFIHKRDNHTAYYFTTELGVLQPVKGGSNKPRGTESSQKWSKKKR